LRFIAPQGRHVAPMWVKFLLRFDRNVEYKRPARGVSLARFSQNLQSLYLLQDELGLKFCWICSRDYGVMGVLS